MAKRKGRELEMMVELIERSLSPLGARVKSPDHIDDTATGQSRETDVSIRITVGSAPILVIVECRNRSKRPDARWIEELSGKRQSLGADKVIAVSTSGFTKQAQIKAKKAGVEIRVLASITEDDVRSWFGAGPGTHFLRKARLLHCRIRVDAISANSVGFEVEGAGEEWIRSCGPYEPLFVRTSNGSPACLIDICDLAVQYDEVWKRVPADNRPLERKLNYMVDDYQLLTPVGLVRVERFIARLDLTIERKPIPVQSVHSYQGEESAISEVVRYNPVDVGGGMHHAISFHREVLTGKSTMVVQKQSAVTPDTTDDPV